MEIEVLEVKPLSADGRPLRGFASVKVGDWIIHDWRIVQKPGERVWVSVPQVSWKDRTGTVRYRALLSISGELRQQIEVAILSAWKKEMHNGRVPH